MPELPGTEQTTQSPTVRDAEQSAVSPSTIKLLNPIRTEDTQDGIAKKELLQYGGQAVIEGVMMRSPRHFAVACRRPDGKIVVQCEEVDKTFFGPIAKLKFLKWPFFRGSFALLDAMALGTRALAFASNVQLIAEQEKNAQTSPDHNGGAQNNDTAPPSTNLPNSANSANSSKQGRINDITIGGTIVFSLVFALLLFKLLPTFIPPGLQQLGLLSKSASPRTLNLLDGLIRMGIFFGYITLISLMPQIRRVFMYHGAEHKAINTLEAGQPLTLENSLASSRIHPRCGTSFIFVVLIIDLVIVTLLPRFDNGFARFALQVGIVPFVAGISYEVIKFAGKFRRNPMVMAAFAPGMATQYLTTRLPDASQVEVALSALYAVLVAEGHDIPASSFYPGTQRSSSEEEPVALV